MHNQNPDHKTNNSRIINAIITEDGSPTLYSEQFKEHYHSLHGALSETQHIFIDLGFKSITKNNLTILEIGYGTGLNAICTYLENKKQNKQVKYIGIEKYPIDYDTLESLKYTEEFNIDSEILIKFSKKWNSDIIISDSFSLNKICIDFNDFVLESDVDLIFFDAFSPDTQPEMWSFENLKKIITRLNSKGIFVTYCAKGELKRNLRSLGMEVKRYPGPPGKRHVIRAVKP